MGWGEEVGGPWPEREKRRGGGGVGGLWGGGVVRCCSEPPLNGRIYVDVQVADDLHKVAKGLAPAPPAPLPCINAADPLRPPTPTPTPPQGFSALKR